MMPRLLFVAFAMAICPAIGVASATDLQGQLSEIFVKRSFTLRNFYQGGKLRYDGTGVLVSKADPGYWSRDGMVMISRVKVSQNNQLVMEGDRYCVEFDPETGEFSNVRTGDHVEITISLQPSEVTMESVLLVLQRVFITSRERLQDIAPPYWADCVSQRVNRPTKNSMWECEALDKSRVPAVSNNELAWDLPPPDNSLHDGTRQYVLEHRVGYIKDEGISLPQLTVAPDPFFNWVQSRVHVGQLTCVLSVLIGEDGRVQDVFIVTPVGMGIDDDAAKAVANWRFVPAKRGGKPVPVHARVVFLISEPNTRITFPWR